MHRLAGITDPSMTRLPCNADWLRLASGLLLVCLLFTGSAQASTELERKVKAAFVYNFAKFIDWPPQISSAGNDFVICVAGQTILGNVISDNLESKPLKNRIINVREIGWSTQQLDGCHILYVNGSATDAVNQMLRAAADKPILTIGESRDFVQKGGIIQFLLVDDKVRFSVNQAAAVKAGLSISAKLLEVAYQVMRAQAGDSDYRNTSAWRHVLLS